MTLRIDSGSSCSPSSVEPVTSQNTIVTVLRTSAASGASAAPSWAPQTEQKFAPSAFSDPQFGQAATGRSLGPVRTAHEPFVRGG